MPCAHLLPRFPEFKLLSAAGRYSDIISCIIITHFHLDHVGGLPYFTEVRLQHVWGGVRHARYWH